MLQNKKEREPNSTQVSSKKARQNPNSLFLAAVQGLQKFLCIIAQGVSFSILTSFVAIYAHMTLYQVYIVVYCSAQFTQ